MIEVNLKKIKFKFHSEGFIKPLIHEYLDNVQAETQAHILRILFNLTTINENSFYEQIQSILIKKKYLDPVIRRISSLNDNVVYNALLLIGNLISVSSNQAKLIEMNIHGRLAQTYFTYNNTQNFKILE